MVLHKKSRLEFSPELPIDIFNHLFYVPVKFRVSFLKMTGDLSRKKLYDLRDERLRLLALLLPELLPAPVVFRKG